MYEKAVAIPSSFPAKLWRWKLPVANGKKKKEGGERNAQIFINTTQLDWETHTP